MARPVPAGSPAPRRRWPLTGPRPHRKATQLW